MKLKILINCIALVLIVNPFSSNAIASEPNRNGEINYTELSAKSYSYGNNLSNILMGSLIKLDLSFLNKIRIVYDKPINDRLSVGTALNGYYGSFKGFKLEPFGRYYFGNLCPEGLYGQGRLLLGSFNKLFLYYPEDGDDWSSITDSFYDEKTVFSAGIGIDLGYQWLSGKNKNIVIDLSLGIQIMSDINHEIQVGRDTYSTANIGFYGTGPGGIFNPHLLIGYKF